MRKYMPVLLGAAIITVWGCEQKVASLQQTVFFDTAAMNQKVNPADDFFEYANGAWVKTAKIPDDYPSWGSFTTLYDENLGRLRTLLERYSNQENTVGSLEQKAGDFYASCMDTTQIEKLSWQPLQPMLTKIDAIKDYRQMLELAAEGYKNGDGVFLGFYIGADEKNSSMNHLVFMQTGLSLPEKGYYTRTDSASVATRKKLKGLVEKYALLTGIDAASAKKQSEQVLDLENKLAAVSRTPVELRDPSSNYNKMPVAAAEKLAPNMNWQRLFAVLGIQPDSIDIAQPGFYKGLNGLLATEPIEVWKAKLRFDYINGRAMFLSKNFRDAQFEFSREFSGLQKMPDRWKQAVDWSDNGLRDVVGQLYVKEYFPESAKLRMDSLVNNLQVAFRNRINKLDWMTNETKAKALEKLSSFMKKIGYPTKWKDYSDVSVSRTNCYENFRSISRHGFTEMIGKLGKPVDKTEWGMTPSTVNAYYNPTNNEIVFPAGILQFPFFHLHADDAINYGAIGMVIGHEMTHGFDDQGRQYDAQGNMKDWWQPSDAEKFKSRADIMVKQYGNYSLFDSMHVNGQLTLGENLADLGGLNIAWDAFKMTKQGQSNEKIDGFTPDQRFFLGYAQIWRTIERPEFAKTCLNVDPHSPNRFRVNGPLANFQPFYTTWKVSSNNKMFREEKERINIW